MLEVGTRRILHWNVTEHPTAEWAIQQFRTVITPETYCRFVLHDRDNMYTATVDRAIASMGRQVLKTPARTPQANAFCGRLIGTMRRECLDWLIPMPEAHLRRVLRDGWRTTTEVVHTPAWVRAFHNRCPTRTSSCPPVIAFPNTRR